MTLQELRYLVALADEGHFARAAEACHISQPTLSTQLRKLENSLGVTLFDRSLRHVAPTAIGREIIAQARVVLDQVGKIREFARREKDPMAGTLKLGVIPTLGPYLLPHLLPAIHQACPGLRLLLREDLTVRLLEQLHSGRLHAALLALPVPDNTLKVEELFSEPFVVALPRAHPLAAKSRLRQRDLLRESVLLLEEGHCMRDQALEICGANRTQISDEVKATSLETLRQMVALGVGCTLLPLLATLSGAGLLEPNLVELRPFAHPVPTRTIGLLWRQRFAREETVKRLASLIRTHLPAGLTALPQTDGIGQGMPRN
jgi:LysR family transcriptional regulator, hydrogen peroxide-inducible genes activator